LKIKNYQKMKKIIFLFFSICVAGSMFAQEIHKVAKAKADVLSEVPADTSNKHWLVQGNGSLAFTQASFTNWSSGGENSLGLVAWVNFKANYKNGKHVWGNNIDLGYGFNILGKGSDAKFNKTNDKIELTTAYGYELHHNKKWYLTVLLNFRTQFSTGYNYPDDSTVISNFMAPGYLIAGLGITYVPVKWFYAYLSPGSGRFTFVMDQKLADSGDFGVERGKNMKGEFGAYFRADLNKDLAKNINITSTLELYSDYLHKFGNIDVNWSLLLSLKVNKWLAASVQTQLIYDDDIMILYSPNEPAGPRTQFKEMLGLGLTYKFK
ncbi:MAG: DUF3078 domain-containing protein, partial [Bacteroidetes bacterium]|nr:DUF3078 domain-containing protein [Bacteroidota bacterium]